VHMLRCRVYGPRFRVKVFLDLESRVIGWGCHLAQHSGGNCGLSFGVQGFRV
jgi:hypothetical protein